jgi:hypothetical protein
MREKLVEMGVETGVSFEPGQGHEFDNKYTVGLSLMCDLPELTYQDTTVEGYDKYILPILDFVDKHAKA